MADLSKIEIMNRIQAGSESGQAMIELLGIMFICIMIGVGIYEAGSFFHNVSVMNHAMENAATYAAQGAPMDEIKEMVEREGANLMAGALLQQTILMEDTDSDTASSIIVEIVNPRTNKTLTHGYRDYEDIHGPFDGEDYSPNRENIAPYVFWAQGYEVRVGVYYRIGIYVPFVKSFVVEQPIVGSRIIQASNDVDRDGLVDSQEIELFGEEMDQDGQAWDHPKHRNDDSPSEHDVLDSDSTARIDMDEQGGYGNCKLVITRVCGSSQCTDPGGDEREIIEVFNPSHRSYFAGTISETETTSGNTNTIWNGNQRVGPGEFIVFSDASDSLHPDLPRNPDVSYGGDQLNRSEDGIRLENTGGEFCDAVGWDLTGTESDVDGSEGTFYLDTVKDHDNDVELERGHTFFEDEAPENEEHNERDFDDLDFNILSDLYTGHAIEKPYDYDNDGIEDKFDPGDAHSSMENPLIDNGSCCNL
ncbi:MAG: TadE/TadG family type IV pilus assembly protein [bacterium]